MVLQYGAGAARLRGNLTKRGKGDMQEFYRFTFQPQYDILFFKKS
jgi:hypothetical protein